jgi:hypothetical protein
MTYRAAITAAAPKSILAQAKMLLIKQSVMKTTWAIRPIRISFHYSTTANSPTISDANNFQRCMGFRNLPLAGDSQQGEEDDHRTAASSEPERARYAIIIANKCRA